ncbi:hypothetical protein RA307_31305 [Xanthobacteraceae bacterium Astr-EGSB]|nr:hypothetical protein [Xanthobacteraceae bacterium Astr-EGSB]
MSLAEREQNGRIERDVIICAARRDWERVRQGLAGDKIEDGPVCEQEVE